MIYLDRELDLDQLVDIARREQAVALSDQYRARVQAGRAAVLKMVEQRRPVYGVTTGFGVLCDRAIPPADAAQLQQNILRSHATAVGAPLTAEQARAVMVLMLQNCGTGHSGIGLEVLEQLVRYLNEGLVPWAPAQGSVGYLSVEAHIALTLIGEGQFWGADGRPTAAATQLQARGIEPVVLGPKEGLSLISGTTSPCALGCLALHDMLLCLQAADCIGALSLEVLGGTDRAFDRRLMELRRHPTQWESARRVRAVLQGSARVEAARRTTLQDAMSLRCIPQLHGAVAETLLHARTVLERELCSCCDNPAVFWEEDTVISGCNPDSSFVGLCMDSACTAAVMLAKMSERRTDRLLSGKGGLPPFLTAAAGLCSGFMGLQYTQAGLLGDMRQQCHPASVDSVPTCGGQEDYVAMGYNSAKRSLDIAQKLAWVLATELLCVLQANYLKGDDLSSAPYLTKLREALNGAVPGFDGDELFAPYVQLLADFILAGKMPAV